MLAYPHSQNILVSVKINTDYHVNGLVDNMVFLLDLVVDSVQKYHGVDGLQRPLLPLPGNGQDLVDDVSDRVA